MKKLAIEQVEYLAHSLAKALMQYDEPLPDFGTRYPGKLESCLEQPFQTFGGNDLYPGLVDKTAVLFYLITKNHPFENGNKRMAVSTSLVFLYVNNYWLKVAPEVLYEIALRVAKSKPGDKDEILIILSSFFKEFISKR
jgi:death-on-curing protein